MLNSLEETVPDIFQVSFGVLLESSIESLFVVSISYSYFSVEFKDTLAPTI